MRKKVVGNNYIYEKKFVSSEKKIVMFMKISST